MRKKCRNRLRVAKVTTGNWIWTRQLWLPKNSQDVRQAGNWFDRLTNKRKMWAIYFLAPRPRVIRHWCIYCRIDWMVLLCVLALLNQSKSSTKNVPEPREGNRCCTISGRPTVVSSLFFISCWRPCFFYNQMLIHCILPTGSLTRCRVNLQWLQPCYQGSVYDETSPSRVHRHYHCVPNRYNHPTIRLRIEKMVAFLCYHRGQSIKRHADKRFIVSLKTISNERIIWIAQLLSIDAFAYPWSKFKRRWKSITIF